jgi:hypothetical protein
MISRAHRVRVQYTDLVGNKQTIDAERALPELLQHELDHLDGVLMVDRPCGLDPFCLREQWQKHYAEDGPYSEPTSRYMITGEHPIPMLNGGPSGGYPYAKS